MKKTRTKEPIIIINPESQTITKGLIYPNINNYQQIMNCDKMMYESISLHAYGQMLIDPFGQKKTNWTFLLNENIYYGISIVIGIPITDMPGNIIIMPEIEDVIKDVLFLCKSIYLPND